MSENKTKTEDEILDYTQQQREKIVSKLTSNGVPGDVKELGIILSALDGMDKVALSKKKLQSDAGLADKFGMASLAITEMLTKMRGDIKETTPDLNRGQVKLPDDLAEPEIVPGELDTLNPNLTYADIMSTGNE